MIAWGELATALGRCACTVAADDAAPEGALTGVESTGLRRIAAGASHEVELRWRGYERPTAYADVPAAAAHALVTAVSQPQGDDAVWWRPLGADPGVLIVVRVAELAAVALADTHVPRGGVAG